MYRERRLSCRSVRLGYVGELSFVCDISTKFLPITPDIRVSGVVIRLHAHLRQHWAWLNGGSSGSIEL
jgi:hypothetical protein